MKTVTITYFGKEYNYPFLSAEDIGEDWYIRIFNHEFSQQGYAKCYNNTKKFHFVSTVEELVKLKELRKKDPKWSEE